MKPTRNGYPQTDQDDFVEAQARVVAIDGNQAVLSAEQSSACGGCGTRSVCSGGTSKRATLWRVASSLGADQRPLALGDVVRIGLDRHALSRATLTAYAIPLATLLIAAVAMQGADDALAVAVSLAGLLAGIGCARVLAKRWRNALIPVVLGRAAAGAASSCETHVARIGTLGEIPVVMNRQRSP